MDSINLTYFRLARSFCDQTRWLPIHPQSVITFSNMLCAVLCYCAIRCAVHYAATIMLCAMRYAIRRAMRPDRQVLLIVSAYRVIPLQVAHQFQLISPC
jgi:energy-coupling factor transporter transmembrane protein EcfT